MLMHTGFFYRYVMSKKAYLKYETMNALPKVYYAITSNKKKFKKEMKRLDARVEWDDISDGRMWSLTRESAGDLILICAVNRDNIPEKASNGVIYGLLAHEAVHAWQEILVHIKETQPGNEIEAYHIQAITSHFIDSFDAGE